MSLKPLFPGDLGRPLSDTDVAEIIGVSVGVVRRQANKFGAVRVGRRYVFFEILFYNVIRNLINLSFVFFSYEHSPYPILDFMSGSSASTAVDVEDDAVECSDPIEDRHALLV